MRPPRKVRPFSFLNHGRLPSGRLHVAKNERRKARLARIGKSSGAEFDHHVSSYGPRVPAQAAAAAVGKPRCMVDLSFWGAVNPGQVGPPHGGNATFCSRRPQQKKNAAPDLQSSFPLNPPRFGVSKTQKPLFFALKRRAGRIVNAFVRILQSSPHFPVAKSEFLNKVSHVGRPA